GPQKGAHGGVGRVRGKTSRSASVCPMPLRLSEHLEHDRPRERFWAVGPAALTGQELLAILLGTGTRGQDALAVAAEILTRGDGSLRRVATRPWVGLAWIHGVGRAKGNGRAS